jgi:hypothetical protein
MILENPSWTDVKKARVVNKFAPAESIRETFD